MTHSIVPIVEGHGDVSALPSLLARITSGIRISRPIRCPKSKLVLHDGSTANAHEVEKVMAIAATAAPSGSVMIALFLDADEHCARTLGPSLLHSMQQFSAGRPCFVSIAVREFENWILGGVADFDEAQPESNGDAKNRIKQRNDGRYRETVDQVAFARRVDVELLASRAPSFRRLVERLRRFTNEPQTPSA